MKIRIEEKSGVISLFENVTRIKISRRDPDILFVHYGVDHKEVEIFERSEIAKLIILEV